MVAAELRAGRSVLLVGPEGIGKSAIARTVAGPGTLLLDPFERVGRVEARRLRQRLDQGAVALATSRTGSRAELGAIGRILWRFRRVRIRALSPRCVRQILADVLRQEGTNPRDLPRAWWTDALAAARGRPGYAVAIARATGRALAESDRWPSPAVAVVDYRLGRTPEL